MISVDSNIFLEVLLNQDKSEDCKKFLNLVCEGKIKSVISNFNISGIVIRMNYFKLGPKEIRTFLLSLMKYEGLLRYPVLLPDEVVATKLMEKYKLDFEDAFTLQCALTNDCKEIVSFDKDFDKVKEIKRIEPREVLSKYEKS